MSSLADTRKIIIDATGNITLPAEVLSTIGGPGVFETDKLEKDIISITRVSETIKESKTKDEETALFCPACGNKYEGLDVDTCLKCGALR